MRARQCDLPESENEAATNEGFFALFDLEPRFTLSLEALDTAFRSLAARVHPDKFARADEAQRRRSMMLAAQANEAYRILRRPLLRARHLLELRGAVIPDRGSSLPTEFLVEHMELREALDDAKRSRNLPTLRSLEATVKSRAALLQQRLAAQLDHERDDVAAVATVQQLMFIEKTATDISDACATLEG